MAHEILGERFMSRGKPAWHGIGHIFDPSVEISASEAVDRVAGDIIVESRPIYYRPSTAPVVQLSEADRQALAVLDEHPELRASFAPDLLKRLDDSKASDGDDLAQPEYRELSKLRAIIRKPTTDDPTEELLGTVSGNWHATSYTKLAKGLDELSRTYKLETAGLLKKGALCFLSLRGESFEVAGDELRSYFVTNLSLQPGVAHQVFHAPVRVVCWNTNTAAERSASIKLQIPHTEDAAKLVGLAADLIARFKDVQNRTQEVFEAFARTPVTDETLAQIINAAHTDPSVPRKLQLIRQTLNGGDQATSTAQEALFRKTFGEKGAADLIELESRYQRDVETTNALRAATRDRFESFDNVQTRGTVWAAYNAVTEVADHRRGKNVASSSLFGSRAQEKARAFNQALALCELN